MGEALVDGREDQEGPPQSVLLDAVVRAVGDAEILGAIFTTYGLDPGFFQDEVLSRLMGQDSAMVRARRLLARDALGEVQPLVLYDAETLQSGTRTDGFRSDLPVHYVGVNHPTGAFHPKLSLILTGPLPGGGGSGDGGDRGRKRTQDANAADVDTSRVPTRLVVVVASANLTPAGWRRNVEVAWTGVVEHGKRCPFRDDLLGETTRGQAGGDGLIARLRGWCGPAGKETLDAMESLVRAARPGRPGTLPRIWHGQARLDTWLSRTLPARQDERTVELVAPFATEPRPTPVTRLIRATGAYRATVRPPKDQDGAVSVTRTWVNALAKDPKVGWGDLPKGVTTAGAGRAKGRASDRYVHAKLLHLREGKKNQKSRGRAWLLSGSPNLTTRGHAGVRPDKSTVKNSSNVEIAVLEEIKGAGRRGWLVPLSDPKVAKEPDNAPEEAAEQPFAGVQLTVDWMRRTLTAEVVSPQVKRLVLHLGPTDAKPAAKLRVGLDGTGSVAGEHVEPLLRHLEVRSVLWAEAKGFQREAVLVQEVGLLRKPDALSRELTPADIMAIWATLEPFRRQQLMEAAMRRAGGADGEEADVFDQGKDKNGRLPALNLFERQAGQFFAFHMLRERLARFQQQGRDRRIEALVFGSNGDSVRSLAGRVLDQQADPVERLILLLCCQEVIEVVRRVSPVLVEAHAEEVDALARQLTQAWEDLATPPGMDPAQLQKWVIASWPGLSP